MNYVNLNLAGIKVRAGYRNKSAADIVERYSADFSEADVYIELGDEYESRIAPYLKSGNEINGEHLAMMLKISEVLMERGIICFHGAAFKWNEKAFIFTAPSGTGKTTQLKHWLSLYRDEIEIINGDKPMLEFREDGKIFVHPSPWNGKEQIHGNVSAELDSIIYLKQDKSDRIEETDGRDLVQLIFHQIFVPSTDTQTVVKIAKLEDYLLKHCRIFELYNTGTEKSAELTHAELSGERDE